MLEPVLARAQHLHTDVADQERQLAALDAQARQGAGRWGQLGPCLCWSSPLKFTIRAGRYGLSAVLLHSLGMLWHDVL